MTATILIADDCPDVAEAIASVLRRAGHLPLRARDGDHAWQLLQQFHIDLLITDRHMPGISGEALIRQLRSQLRFAKLPVIVTGIGERPDLDAVWLAKPLQLPQLPSLMMDLLQPSGSLRRPVSDRVG
jgi:CheY-like chemotaxis protein